MDSDEAENIFRKEINKFNPSDSDNSSVQSDDESQNSYSDNDVIYDCEESEHLNEFDFNETGMSENHENSKLAAKNILSIFL